MKFVVLLTLLALLSFLTPSSSLSNPSAAMRRKRKLRRSSGSHSFTMQQKDGEGKITNGWDPATRSKWNGACSDDGTFQSTSSLTQTETPPSLKDFFVPKLNCHALPPTETTAGCVDDPNDPNADDQCLFTPAFDKSEYMMHWRAYCLQIDIPFPSIPGLQLSLGLNTEYRTGAGCSRSDESFVSPQACSMSLKGEVSIGLTWTTGLHHLPSASIYLTGSLEIHTLEGKPCPPSIVRNGEDGTWTLNRKDSCGHARLFRAWLSHFFATSGIFKNKAFTGAMYSSTVKNAAELRAESKRAEDQEEIANIVSSLNGMDKKTQDALTLPFAPKNHPLYKTGKIWNIQFEEYWFRNVIVQQKNWWKKDVAAHRHLQNRLAYKAALHAAADQHVDAATVESSGTSQTAPTGGIPDKEYINAGMDPAGFGIKKTSMFTGGNKMKNFGNKMKRIGSLGLKKLQENSIPWAINFKKSFETIGSQTLRANDSLKDIARLFIW